MYFHFVVSFNRRLKRTLCLQNNGALYLFVRLILTRRILVYNEKLERDMIVKQVLCFIFWGKSVRVFSFSSKISETIPIVSKMSELLLHMLSMCRKRSKNNKGINEIQTELNWVHVIPFHIFICSLFPIFFFFSTFVFFQRLRLEHTNSKLKWDDACARWIKIAERFLFVLVSKWGERKIENERERMIFILHYPGGCSPWMTCNIISTSTFQLIDYIVGWCRYFE